MADYCQLTNACTVALFIPVVHSQNLLDPENAIPLLTRESGVLNAYKGQVIPTCKILFHHHHHLQQQHSFRHFHS
jgi:hypothetical protein